MTITSELYAGEFQPSFLLTSLCIKTGCNNKDNKCYTFVAIGSKKEFEQSCSTNYARKQGTMLPKKFRQISSSLWSMKKEDKILSKASS